MWKNRRKNGKYIVIGIIGLFILYKIISVLFIVFIAQPVKVEGNTMSPSLNNGDLIIISKNIDKIERGDIVVFRFPKDQSKSMIKRIIALPGEIIDYKESKIVINGKELEEPYVDKNSWQMSFKSTEPVKVPDDSYFVMGDNRDASNDSRFYGPINKSLIYGKFSKKYYDAK
jgi:signal peptidase I